jgi:hypothetical protein
MEVKTFKAFALIFAGAALAGFLAVVLDRVGYRNLETQVTGQVSRVGI